MAEPGLVGQIGNELGRIFRHMLPGLTVLGASMASHPSWFGGTVDPSNLPWLLAVFAVGSVVVGNTWYVFHRFTLHQALDWLWYARREGPKEGYLSWLYQHIDDSFHLAKGNTHFREFVIFRSAQVHFMFVTAEAVLLFRNYPERDSFLDLHWFSSGWVGGLMLFAAIVQHRISHGMDLHLVEKHRAREPVLHAAP